MMGLERFTDVEFYKLQAQTAAFPYRSLDSATGFSSTTTTTGGRIY